MKCMDHGSLHIYVRANEPDIENPDPFLICKKKKSNHYFKK